MWLIQVSASQSSPWLTSSINFTPPYFWLSLALNISMTLAIVSRLLVFRWRISSALGPKFGTQYTSIASMLVESAVLYSASALLFLIPFALNHPLANTFIQMLSEVQVCFSMILFSHKDTKLVDRSLPRCWSSTVLRQARHGPVTQPPSWLVARRLRISEATTYYGWPFRSSRVALESPKLRWP